MPHNEISYTPVTVQICDAKGNLIEDKDRKTFNIQNNVQFEMGMARERFKVENGKIFKFDEKRKEYIQVENLILKPNTVKSMERLSKLCDEGQGENTLSTKDLLQFRLLDRRG